MDLLRFYARNSAEVVGLVGQHVWLVTISTAIALVIGVPLGVLLTRRPALRTPVLGLANVFQTVPSLALFGFLIPLPFIGGIGATTAIVALVVYALLPIVRNTYEGIAGVDAAVREAARGMGMTDWQLLTRRSPRRSGPGGWASTSSAGSRPSTTRSFSRELSQRRSWRSRPTGCLVWRSGGSRGEGREEAGSPIGSTA